MPVVRIAAGNAGISHEPLHYRGRPPSLSIGSRYVIDPSEGLEINVVPKELKSNDNRRQLEGSIKFLGNQRFLLQGFAWDCRRCQHPNWVHLQDIRPELSCEICRAEKAAPVCGDENIHFRLNPFVAEAFSSASSQGPVFWCLKQLMNRASHSMMFTPALDIHRPGEQERYTDIDLLASVDGEVFLLEVKKSFAGINPQQLKQLLEVARLVRPNVAGFAVERPAEAWTIEAATKDRFVKALSEIDVRFDGLERLVSSR
jgi:hypothetical protein